MTAVKNILVATILGLSTIFPVTSYATPLSAPGQIVDPQSDVTFVRRGGGGFRGGARVFPGARGGINRGGVARGVVRRGGVARGVVRRGGTVNVYRGNVYRGGAYRGGRYYGGYYPGLGLGLGFPGYGYGYGYGYSDRYYAAPTAVGFSDHDRWCAARYRSYNPRTNLFFAYSGEFRACISPYSN